jgi:hypothetical protein
MAFFTVSKYQVKQLTAVRLSETIENYLCGCHNLLFNQIIIICDLFNKEKYFQQSRVNAQSLVNVGSKMRCAPSPPLSSGALTFAPPPSWAL